MAFEKKCLNTHKSSVQVYVRLLNNYMRLIHIMLDPDISEFENSIDPDQLASSIFINIHVNI